MQKLENVFIGFVVSTLLIGFGVMLLFLRVMDDE